MRRLHIWAGAAISALVVLGLGWLLLSPGWAIAAMQEEARVQLGRVLQVKGGAHLTLSPLSIRLDDASLGGLSGQDESFITARSIHIPIGISQLLTHRADLSSLTLDDAEFALLIDERGQASWEFPAIKTASTLTLSIEGGSIRYFDVRNSQSLSIPALRAIATVSSDGSVSAIGTSEMRGRLVRFDAVLKSLARVQEDGSPLELSIQTNEATAAFEGRITTAKVLSLAGPINLSSPDLRSAARWAGLQVEDGTSFKALAIDGALDSAGRAFAIRKSNIMLDGIPFSGDVVLDLRNERPKLQAALQAPSLALDSFVPGSGANDDGWGPTSLGYTSLRSFDAEINLVSASLSYGGLKDLQARLAATLLAGNFKVSISAVEAQRGHLELTCSIDASVLPSAFALDLKASGIDTANLLQALGDIDWTSGVGDFSAEVSGTGQTQEEIIGTLKGTASFALHSGALAGNDLSKSLQTVTQRIVEGWSDEGGGSTPYDTLSADFTIADGIATTNNLVLENPLIRLDAKGDIDLLRRAINLRSDPKFKTSGATKDFPVSIIARGPWAKPRLYPDIKDILIDPAGGFETLKSMGLAAGN